MTSPQQTVPNLVTDWRGVEVRVGDRVIYAAGTSGAIVEGTVLKVNPGHPSRYNSPGTIKVDIVRRNDSRYWSGTRRVNTIGADRVTVVGSLPPSAHPTLEELVLKHELELKNRDSHTGLSWRVDHCSKCKMPWAEAGNEPCPYGRLP